MKQSRSTNSAVRVTVIDRSDRLHFYGFMRAIPIGVYVSSILMFPLALAIQGVIAQGVILFYFFGGIILAFWLDRSKLLDPVHFVIFGDCVIVKRMMSQQQHPFSRVRGIEFRRPTGEDYDDSLSAEKRMEIVVRLRYHWPARLLVLKEEAAAVADWARLHRVTIWEVVPTADGT